MPKINNCCPSKSGSCVQSCVKQCREKYCRSKYEKLAKKLIKTGLVQDTCNYQADRNLDTVAGGKWNWLNNYLIKVMKYNLIRKTQNIFINLLKMLHYQLNVKIEVQY